jgi:hypothetical protein
MTGAKGFRPPDVARTCCCVLALLLFASVASTQNARGTARTIATKGGAVASGEASTARISPEKPPTAHGKVSYEGGQLKVHARDTTLADILIDAGALIGVTIDIPDGAGHEKLALVELGPGPPREILTSLLAGSTFDYLIQDSGTDPEKIQNVLLLPREKSGAVDMPNSQARVSSSPYARAFAPSVRSEDRTTPVAPDNTATVASVSPPGSDQSAPPPAPESGQSPQLPLSQQSNQARSGTLPPPQTLNSQSINQQLQSMYQQRMQMIQPAGASAAGNQGK